MLISVCSVRTIWHAVTGADYILLSGGRRTGTSLVLIAFVTMFTFVLGMSFWGFYGSHRHWLCFQGEID